MSSWSFDWIKKNVCACLINRYLSQFIENVVTKDQLKLDLYNGLATAERISLAVETLNELSTKQNWPIEFVDGYVEKIKVHLPWSRIFVESAVAEVTGLTLTVQPKERTEDATSMFESMWNSMTSSLHLAEEYAKTQGNNLGEYEGIESFAKVIQYIFKKIKVELKNTVINIEYLPKNSIKGVGLRIDIESLTYSDENPNENPFSDGTTKNAKKAYVIDSFTTKVVHVEGISLSTIEFSNIDRFSSKTNTSETQSDYEQDDNSEHFVEANDDDVYSERHTILFGKFYNTQEIKIKLKESEDISGPKVTIEVNCSALILFLSPRQFHIVIELLLGFCTPNLDDENIVNAQNQSKPMTEQDYEKIQEQLGECTNHINKFKFYNSLMKQGWATGNLEDSADDNEYVLMKGATNMYDSNITGISSSMDSSMMSSVTSAATDNTSHTRRANHIDNDPSAEISRFQIRLATFAAIILHEDILNMPDNNEIILVRKMINTVQDFFKKISNFSNHLGCDSFKVLHNILDKACSSSHSRLIASPIQVEADEKTTSSAFSILGYLTAHKFELIECLYNNDDLLSHIPLFTFNQSSSSSSSSNSSASSKPNVKLKFRHIQKKGKKSLKNSKPKTDLALHLDKCTVDFDISIIDRITAILNHTPITNLYENRSSCANVEDDDANMFEFKILCELLNFKLRFPIPDFRAAHDLTKVQWWERNVRSDYISLLLHQVTFNNVINKNCDFDEYLLKCKVVDAHYHETETAVPLHIARSGNDDKSTLPTKLTIKVRSKNQSKEEVPVLDPMAHSYRGAFEMTTNFNNGPFGAKKVWHESDTSHNDSRKDASDELVIPGDRNELKNFIESTTSEAQLALEFTFPILLVHLQSKHVYELIYNRISNDLLLWKPGAPKPCSNASFKTDYGIFKDLDGDGDYVMANSGMQNDLDSDSSDDSDSACGNIFYSTYDNKQSKLSLHVNQEPQENKSQTELALSFCINEGLLCLNSPVRDSGSNVIPGQQGELLLDVKNAKIFIANGYKGQPDIGYVCVQLCDAELFHCDMKPMPNSMSSLKDICLSARKNQSSLIYKANQQSLASFKNLDSARDMFSAAVKIQSNHETHHVKVVTVSLGVYGAILKHKMCKEPNTWISQIIDFFTVQDYPIPGYIPKDVLTELHLHLWNCLIDYRPFYLPLRSVVTVGNFSLCSHLTVASNMSTLRLIFEDCGLFLSEKNPPKNGVPSNVSIDLRKDYVNVVDLPLLEISIKTTDKKSGKHPHIDLRASSNKLIIRTCSDSARALFELLIYYINDGDMSSDTELADDFDSCNESKNEEELVQVNTCENTVPKNQQEQIAEMLEEAIRDNDYCEKKAVHQRPSNAVGPKLFYFPDEKEMLDESPQSNFPQVSSDLGDVNPYCFGIENDEEEFCIIGSEEYPFYPKDGIPEITWLTSEPVRIIEQHMSAPVGKKDVLEAPKGFPLPVNSYTLCEMSIIWQWFGGNDFTTSNSNKKEVRFADKCFDNKVRFSSLKEKVTIGQQRSDASNWIINGGLNRDRNVLMELQLNKIRFKHEIYPETTKQASRQALTIGEIEIRDRLESSQINKFLYQYSSQSRPKKSHSNMVLIRALHIRPDSKLKTQECLLKIALLPIKLNIDQDALFFMIKFFKELSGDSAEPGTIETIKDTSLQSTPTHQPPIMSVSLSNEDEIKARAKQAVNENLILLESRYNPDAEEISDTAFATNTDSSSPIYFKHVEFARDVFIRLDYHGKRVDMSHGPIAGLLIGLGQLNCSEIKLKRIVHRHGLLGLGKLFAYLLQEWINDIKRNQLSTILAGVGIMLPVAQLLQGVRDLFWLPIEQYQKDGRIVRGLQKGANSFTTSTAMAALELTTRIIYLIQITAETAYDMLSPGPSIRMKKIARLKGRKKKHYQAQDIREGLTNACQVFKEGFGETAENFYQVAALEKEQKGITGAVGAVIRQIPATVIKPIVIVTDATNNLLGGVQSQFVPDAKTEANQKWRTEN